MSDDPTSKRREFYNSCSGQILVEMLILCALMVFLFFEIQSLIQKSQTQRKKSELIYETKN